MKRVRDGQPLLLHFLGVRKTYFNAFPQRSMYLKLPTELSSGKGVVGKLRKRIYGTRDAETLWETTFTNVPVKLGFRQEVACPCCFHHGGWGVSLVVHGDDVTALGTAGGLDKYGRGMVNAFQCELRWRLSVGHKDQTQTKLLSRVIKVTPKRLTDEADQKHVCLLAKALGLEKCGAQRTPAHGRAACLWWSGPRRRSSKGDAWICPAPCRSIPATHQGQVQ